MNACGEASTLPGRKIENGSFPHRGSENIYYIYINIKIYIDKIFKGGSKIFGFNFIKSLIVEIIKLYFGFNFIKIKCYRIIMLYFDSTFKTLN